MSLEICLLGGNAQQAATLWAEWDTLATAQQHLDTNFALTALTLAAPRSCGQRRAGPRGTGKLETAGRTVQERTSRENTLSAPCTRTAMS